MRDKTAKSSTKKQPGGQFSIMLAQYQLLAEIGKHSWQSDSSVGRRTVQPWENPMLRSLRLDSGIVRCRNSNTGHQLAAAVFYYSRISSSRCNPANVFSTKSTVLTGYDGDRASALSIVFELARRILNLKESFTVPLSKKHTLSLYSRMSQCGTYY